MISERSDKERKLAAHRAIGEAIKGYSFTESVAALNIITAELIVAYIPKPKRHKMVNGIEKDIRWLTKKVDEAMEQMRLTEVGENRAETPSSPDETPVTSESKS